MDIEEFHNESMCCLVDPDGTIQLLTIAPDPVFLLAQINLLNKATLSQSLDELIEKGFRFVQVRVTIIQDKAMAWKPQFITYLKPNAMSKAINLKNNEQSMLDYLLSILTKHATEKEKKEMEIYDNIEFNDVNKEIKEKKTEVGSFNSIEKNYNMKTQYSLRELKEKVVELVKQVEKGEVTYVTVSAEIGFEDEIVFRAYVHVYGSVTGKTPQEVLEKMRDKLIPVEIKNDTDVVVEDINSNPQV